MNETETLLNEHLRSFGEILRNEITTETKFYDLLDTVTEKTDKQYPLNQDAYALLESTYKQLSSEIKEALSKFDCRDLDDFERAIERSLAGAESKIPKRLVEHKILFDSELKQIDERYFIVVRLLIAESKANKLRPLTEREEKLLMKAYVYQVLVEDFQNKEKVCDSLETIISRGNAPDEITNLLKSNKKAYQTAERFLGDTCFILSSYPL